MERVTDFAAPATGGGEFRLADCAGRIVVLYFYPKDGTAGCTSEATAFRDRHEAFLGAGAVIAGVSRDGMRSHERFKAALDLPFVLLADPEERLCTRFGVIKVKRLYGKEVRGIERSTFVIDRTGILVREWRGVKVAGHVDAVLLAVRALA